MSNRTRFNSNALMQNIYRASQEADNCWERDNRAATKIQSVVRMHHQRRVFLFLRKCAVSLQRVYRGYCGRLRVLEERIANAEKRQAQIFHCHARNIQRIFRGFICRKYTNDFCAQKAYIARIAQTSDSVRQEALRARNDQEKYLAKEQLKELRKDFINAAKDQHHLLSTAVCPGVFRNTLEPEGNKTVFGTDVEDEIRGIPLDPQEVKIRRSKFLKDVIPVDNSNNSASQTSRTNNNNNTNKFSGSTMMNTIQSAKTASERSAQKAASTRQTISQEPYKRSVHSETEYGVNDRDIQRRVENQIITKLHGKQSGAAYFHVPKNIASASKGANLVGTGFTAKMRS